MKKAVEEAKKLMYERRRMFHENKNRIKKNINLNLGKRRLFFTQTYDNKKKLIKELLEKEENKIRVATYVQYPQMLINESDNRLELNPAVCYRLELNKYQPPKKRNNDVVFRLLKDDQREIDEINEIYKNYRMLAIDRETLKQNQFTPAVDYYIAEKNNHIVGIVIGIDHLELFNSPEKGSSLWGLAVKSGDEGRGIGKLLIDYLVGRFKTKGLMYMDLYVDYDNEKAIGLYENLGFYKIPRFHVIPKK